MQFDSKSRRKTILRNAEDLKNADRDLNVDTNLCMYYDPPGEDISLFEFEEIAAERLKALRKLDELTKRLESSSNKAEEMKIAFRKEMVPIMPLLSGHGSPEILPKLRRRDIIGHFALRLAFCRSLEDTKWFVDREITLFRQRFQNESKNSVTSFFRQKNNKFDAVIVETAEKEEMIEDLAASSGLSPDQVRSTDFWKIDALEALDLVKKREVLLLKGMCYLPYTKLLTIVVQRLRTTINAAMARANRFIGVLEEQNRLLPRLDRLTKGSFGMSDFKPGDGQSITRHQIDALSKEFFPLCMSACHSSLRKNHHLKHGGRRQYGLFLKAIGLPLEEALAFFREEFTRKMEADKFDKQYAYNVRHSYGKEGCRKNYTAFSCASIILGNPPGQEDCHGCPFKHSKEDDLRRRLKEDGIGAEQVQNIIDLTKITQYDKACTLQMELSRGMEAGALKTLITHPNQYYELARDMGTGRTMGTTVKDEVKEEPMETD